MKQQPLSLAELKIKAQPAIIEQGLEYIKGGDYHRRTRTRTKAD